MVKQQQEWICLTCRCPFLLTVADQIEADRRRAEQLGGYPIKTTLEMFCPDHRERPEGNEYAPYEEVP